MAWLAVIRHLVRYAPEAPSRDLVLLHFEPSMLLVFKLFLYLASLRFAKNIFLRVPHKLLSMLPEMDLWLCSSFCLVSMTRAVLLSSLLPLFLFLKGIISLFCNVSLWDHQVDRL